MVDPSSGASITAREKPMSFTQVGLARATKRPQRLDGHGGLIPDRPPPRIDGSGQGSPHVHKLETRPEQVESSDPHTTNLAAPAKSASVGDLAPSETAQRLIEWSTAKSVLSGDRLIVLGLAGWRLHRARRRILHCGDGRAIARSWPVAAARWCRLFDRSSARVHVRCRALNRQLHDCCRLGQRPTSHRLKSGATCSFRTRPMRWAHWRWFC